MAHFKTKFGLLKKKSGNPALVLTVVCAGRAGELHRGADEPEAGAGPGQGGVPDHLPQPNQPLQQHVSALKKRHKDIERNTLVCVIRCLDLERK